MLNKDLINSTSIINDNCCLLEKLNEKDIYDQQKNKVLNEIKFRDETDLKCVLTTCPKMSRSRKNWGGGNDFFKNDRPKKPKFGEGLVRKPVYLSVLVSSLDSDI